ncbi:MAG: PIG-L family deacetylase [Verrucomicrobia bacterium]|nr:PIG-L family deacetylase [Verrucomicrobiota bacterium]MBU1734311.1 PIG-L family deacetylase [Verrucomicrobiota bacterium]MBU1857032.1 PIG-L family deacetylase [Verrucomicrobiota bacterium]
MNILALAAHPDDIEFMCAGTLILLKERGHAITMATVNNGSCGSATLPPDEIARIRALEARRAAELIGATYDCVGIPDLESVFDNPTRRKVSELMRCAQPDIVLTISPGDYMVDHEIANLLARDATFTATLGNYSTGAPHPAPIIKRLPYLYYFSTVEGLDHFGQDVFLDIITDISSVMDKKAAMLCCHASQREWLRHEHGMDEYVEFMQRQSKHLGARRGYAFGEGFRQHRGHAYPRDNILEKLLAQKP